MQKAFYFFITCFTFSGVFAQRSSADSVTTLEEVMVSAFGQNRKIMLAPFAVSKIKVAKSQTGNSTSLVSTLNSVAGVRMEERSPASYRINIRGSSLRSPFGVRNVKIYWNGIPVTDPGGNTYFNQFATNNFSFIEIFKGPASSMYGAGTGGLILLESIPGLQPANANLSYERGSYNLSSLSATGRLANSAISFAHNEADGYRDHSRMRRDNISFVNNDSISRKMRLTTSILYSNLYYQTPGGLTKTEFDSNPRGARPSAGGFPSADKAKAAIYQTNFLAGMNQEYKFNTNIQNTTSIYAAFAQIKNPTFRNYERRNEPHFGGRTQFQFEKRNQSVQLKGIIGAELQQGFFNTLVSKNNAGNADTMLTNDDVRYNNYSIFMQGDAFVAGSWVITAGLSLYNADAQIRRLNKYPVINQQRKYSSEWSPRLAVLKKIDNKISLFGSISKGFSPPTIGELLPSTGNISTFLEAEEGTNYEAGAKLELLSGRLYLEGETFYFKLKNALVVRKDASNADYYVNAGEAEQKGIEITAWYLHKFSQGSAIFERWETNAALSLNAFSYLDFQKDNTNYNGKKLPGVPSKNLSVVSEIWLRHGFQTMVSWYGASKTFLNDANNASMPGYKLLGIKETWNFRLVKKLSSRIYFGVENLLDEKYSLGNDINASGGRYYNAAPGRNYYTGIQLSLL